MTVADGLIDQRRIGRRQFVRILAPVDGALAHFLIAEIGQIGVVELDVAAAGFGQERQFLAIQLGKVGEEPVEIGIGVLVDGVAAAPEMGHGRRRQGDLHRMIGERGGELVIFHLDAALGQRHPADHPGHEGGRLGFILGFMLLVLVGDRHRPLEIPRGVDVDDLLDEVDVEAGAPELAVGDGRQTHILLHLDRFPDAGVFVFAQQI